MKIFHFDTITSTNDAVKELLLKENEVIVTSNFQTSGRGRNNRTWLGNYGENIYLSYGVNHKNLQTYERIVLYQSIGCIAVFNVINNLSDSVKCRLKYPNDVYAFDFDKFKKISGTLVEHSFSGNICKSSIIGIGLNVNQVNFDDDLKENATSLKNIGINIEIKELTDLLISELVKLLKFSNDEIFNLWENKLNIVDKNIKILGDDNQYKVKKILIDGRLLLIDLNNYNERIIDDGDSVRYVIE